MTDVTTLHGGKWPVPGGSPQPAGVAVTTDYLYVTDAAANRIHIYFMENGTIAESFGESGINPGQLSAPTSIALHNNYMFIADWGNGRVDVFCAALDPPRNPSADLVLFTGPSSQTLLLDLSGNIVDVTVNVSGTIPPGMEVGFTTTVVPNDGISLFGIPDTTGTFIFNVSVFDLGGCHSTPFTITVVVFDAPGRIDNYAPYVVTDGGDTLTLIGYFPNDVLRDVMPDLTISAWISGRECTSLYFYNDTTADCISPIGYGDRNIITLMYSAVSMEFLANVTYEYLSYASPIIDSVDGDGTLITTGGTLITVHGQNFGPTGATSTLRIAGLLCTSVTYITEHHVVTCIAPPGVGDKSKMNITVGDDYRGYLSGTGRVVYSPETFGCSKLRVWAGQSTDGGKMLTICGENFGIENLEQTSALGTWEGSRQVMVRHSLCDITYINDTAIICKLPPGVGRINAVKVNLNNILWITTGINVHYPPPVLTQVKPPDNIVSGMTISVYGYNFGYLTPDAPRLVTIGPDATCKKIILYGNDMFTCVVSGGRGSNQPLTVWIDSQTHTNSFTIDYAQRASTDLSCLPPMGAQDPINPDICNCYSGYSPNSDSSDCLAPTMKKRCTYLIAIGYV